MIKLLDIFEALEGVLRALFPNVQRIHLERIKKLDVPAISLELISYDAPAESYHTANKRVDVDIIYFSSSNTIMEALNVGDRLTNALALGLKVKDRYIKVSEKPEMRLVDQDLHCLIEYEFADALGNYAATDDGKVVKHDPGNTNLDNTIKDDTKDLEIETEEDEDLTIHQEKLEFMETLKVDYIL